MDEQNRDADEERTPDTSSDEEGTDEQEAQGSKQDDNPDPEVIADGKEGGLGGATGALGGGESTEGDGKARSDQLHPHGGSGA